MFKPLNVFESDIQAQPQSLKNALDFYRSEGYFEKMAGLGKQGFERVVMTGMGSSYAASMNAASLLKDGNVRVYLEVTSDLLHYHPQTVKEGCLLVMVSQSGVSGETVELCRKLPDNVHVLAITNNPNSTLASFGTDTVLMHVEDEVTVSTRTYLASQILMYMFAKAYLGADENQTFEELYRAVDMLEASLAEFETMRSNIQKHLGIPRYLCLIARGWNYTTADAGALFIREVAKYPSISFESAQFRHGPIELVSEGFAAMVFVPGGLCQEMQLRLVKEIVAHGGKVVVVAQDSVNVPKDDNILTIHQRYPSQELAPLVNILPVQAFADYINLDGGYDVCVFRCGSKITDTQ